MTNNDSTIVAALGGTLVISYVNDIANGTGVTMKPLLAVFVAGTLLFGVALWSDDTAKMFAILLLVTSLVLNGKQIFDTARKVAG